MARAQAKAQVVQLKKAIEKKKAENIDVDEPCLPTVNLWFLLCFRRAAFILALIPCGCVVVCCVHFRRALQRWELWGRKMGVRSSFAGPSRGISEKYMQCTGAETVSAWYVSLVAHSKGNKAALTPVHVHALAGERFPGRQTHHLECLDGHQAECHSSAVVVGDDVCF